MINKLSLFKKKQDNESDKSFTDRSSKAFSLIQNDMPNSPVNLIDQSNHLEDISSFKIQSGRKQSVRRQAVKSFQNIKDDNTNQIKIITKKDIQSQMAKQFRKDYLIQNFALKLLKLSGIRAYNSLNSDQFQLINDLSYQDSLEASKQKIQYLFYYFQCIIKKLEIINVFSPNLLILFIWKILMFCLILIQVVVFPLKIGWNFEINILYWNVLPIIMHIIDIILSFNTSFYDDGIIITDRKKIKQNYLSFQFWIDISTIIAMSLSLIIEIEELNIIYLIRIYQIQDILKDIEDKFRIQEQFPTAWTLMKLIFQIFYVGHFFGCIFYFVAKTEIQNGEKITWLHKQDIVDSDFREQYIDCLYFSFITMITVGYGDITPVTVTEKLYVILMTLLSCGQFAYTINIIQNIFQELAKKQEKFIEKKQKVSKFMAYRNIDNNIQQKVIKFIDNMERKENEKPNQGLEILDQISIKLKEEVFQDFYGKILKNCTPFLKSLSLVLKETLYGSGEIIYTQNENIKCIYFVIKGEVELYVNQSSHQNSFQSKKEIFINNIQSGNFFAHQEFISGKQSNHSAKCLVTSHIVYCMKDDFVQLIKDFKYDFQKFCELKDSINLSGNRLFESCFYCSKEKHNACDCPHVHLTKSRQKIVNSHCFDRINERKESIRRKFKFKSLKKYQLMKKKLKKMRCDLIHELQSDPSSASDSSSDSIQSISLTSDHEFFQKHDEIVFNEKGLQIQKNNNLYESQSSILFDDMESYNMDDFIDKYPHDQQVIIDYSKQLHQISNSTELCDDKKLLNSQIKEKQKKQDQKINLNQKKAKSPNIDHISKKEDDKKEENNQQTSQQINQNNILYQQDERQSFQSSLMYHYDMDLQKQFKHYFPYYNLEFILKNQCSDQKIQKRISFQKKTVIMKKFQQKFSKVGLLTRFKSSAQSRNNSIQGTTFVSQAWRDKVLQQNIEEVQEEQNE